MYRNPFTDFERERIELELRLLAGKLRLSDGAKLEEYHWADAYRKARGLSQHKWSNLPFRDYLHDGLGVEFKLLQRASPEGDQGRALMHPSASRQLTFNEHGSAETAKVEVLRQWGETIERFRLEVAATRPDSPPEIRWGVLLWKPDFGEFLYFEEDIERPNPKDFYAKWSNQEHRGKPTRNLHIFAKKTDAKKFSVTLPSKGAKLQPYFTVPTVEQGAVLFRIAQDSVLVPLWLSRQLFLSLELDQVDIGRQDEWLRRQLGRS